MSNLVLETPAHLGKAKINPGPGRFLRYQMAWIADKARLKIAEKSRQIGFTWTEAYRIVAALALATALWDYWITSRDEIQARLFLEDCKGFAKVLQIGAQDLGLQVIDEERNSAYVQQFANGRRANSMSSNPDAQAGKRGARSIDEFALHKDQRKLYSIAYPGITWGGDLSIFSTHRGTASFFNRLLTEARDKNPKKFSVHRVTLQDALDQGFLYKLQSKLPEGDERLAMDEADYFNFIRSGCADDETFLQEYMCVPSDDASCFLGYDDIDPCRYGAEEMAGSAWQTITTGDLYAGVDLGRTRDLTVIKVLERLGDTLYTRRVIEIKDKPFAEQEAELDRVMMLPNMRRVCIDQTGLGRQFVERAQARYGTYRVEGVTFTAGTKEQMAYPLKAAFEDRRLRIPDSDILVADLRSVRKETTMSGATRFAGERGVNGHADRFWALALAILAAKKTGTDFHCENI